MEQFTHTIQDSDGLHARPAGMLAKLAQSCASDISIQKDGKTADAKRLFSVMSLSVKTGETITFRLEGTSAGEDCRKLKEFCKKSL